MDDVFAAFEFRGVIALLAVDSARTLRFGGILVDGGGETNVIAIWSIGKERGRIRR
jgi:hypothetical protein